MNIEKIIELILKVAEDKEIGAAYSGMESREPLLFKN